MRVFAICMVLCMTVQLVNGQIFTDRSRSAVFGVRVGLNSAGWTGLVYDIPDTEYAAVRGFHAGAFVNVRVADAVGLEPGAYYSTKGWEGSGSLEDGSDVLEGTLTNKLSYLDLPLFLRIYVGGLNFSAGPQVSLLLSSKAKFEGTINSEPVSTEDDTTIELNDVDFGLALSLGYEFKIGLSLHATYNIGLTDNVVLSPYFTWTEARNRALKLSVGMVLY